MGVTAVYRAIMLCLEARRLALGFPMEKFSEWAGVPERYYPKALMADSPSGRQASWETLQTIIDALYPHGLDIVILSKPGAVIRAGDMKAELLKLRENANPETYREKMRRIGALGGAKGGSNRWKKMNARARSRIARKAAKARWEMVRQHRTR